MTGEEAKRRQNELAKHYNLGWWYGVRCEKCCGVYPKFMTTEDTRGLCYYQCEVCGRKTKKFLMPWIAEEAWNNREYESEYLQMSLW